MKDFFTRFRIPTVLGLGIIITGIAAGVFLVVREQTFISQASPDTSAQNIILSNITDNSVTLSWQTSTPTGSFVTYGQASPGEQTVLDDRDIKTPIARSIHYVIIKNLFPKTTYQYRIVLGKSYSEIGKFTTTSPVTTLTAFRPVIGSILDKDKPLEEGVVYLSIADATTQSAVVKDSGNFLISLSQIRKSDLSDIFPLTEESIIKLTAIARNGQTTALFKLKDAEVGLPTLKLGENLDLTVNPLEPSPSPSIQELNIYDLNGDGKINAADNGIVLQNFGRNPNNKKADLNSDGTVDQKDLNLMSEHINE